MPAPHPPSSPDDGEQILRSLHVVTVELERLRGERASTVATLAQHWVGGRRLRYEAELDAFEAESRRLTESVHQLIAVQRRLVTEMPAADSAESGSGSGSVAGAAITNPASPLGVGQ